MAKTDGTLFDEVMAASRILLDLANANNTGTGYSLGTYAVVTKSDPELARICTGKPRYLDCTWAGKLAHALYGTGASKDRPPVFRISFEKDEVCGNSDFVACAENDRSVSISLDQLSYWSDKQEGSEESLVIGDPAGDRYSLAAVLLHEAGHFLGLPYVPHEDLRMNMQAAMLAAVEPGTCLSMTERMMLNSAADLHWAYGQEEALRDQQFRRRCPWSWHALHRQRVRAASADMRSALRYRIRSANLCGESIGRRRLRNRSIDHRRNGMGT